MTRIWDAIRRLSSSTDEERDDLWIRFGVAGVAVLLMLLLTKIADLAMSPQNVIVACSVSAALVSVSVGIIDLLHRDRHSLVTDRLLKDLGGLVPTRTRPPWLLTEDELRRKELEARVPSIWVVTPDFKNDIAQKSSFRDVVNANLARSVRYVYIYPSTERNQYRRRNMNFSPDQLRLIRFVPIRPEEFRLLAVTEIAIYNPTRDEQEDPISALMALPVAGAPFWILLEAKAAEDIVARFASIVDGDT